MARSRDGSDQAGGRVGPRTARSSEGPGMAGSGIGPAWPVAAMSQAWLVAPFFFPRTCFNVTAFFILISWLLSLTYVA